MPSETCVWVGSFSASDREEIESLGSGQADAIERRDAEAYAQLCTEDIVLVFPGYDVVQGQRAFIECETQSTKNIMSTATETPQWIGTFTAEDRTAIEALRLGQARAIEQGDAEAYAGLCAADIHLMLPGRDIVAGRDQLKELQAGLFREAKFTGMRKHPIRVERSGDLVVEVGRQELATKTGTFAAGQKYTHVMRKTNEGWRFAVLMSNNSE